MARTGIMTRKRLSHVRYTSNSGANADIPALRIGANIRLLLYSEEAYSITWSARSRNETCAW